jgi:hypothetical protein
MIAHGASQLDLRGRRTSPFLASDAVACLFGLFVVWVTGYRCWDVQSVAGGAALNADSELSTEDLARPGGAREEEGSAVEAPREQVHAEGASGAADRGARDSAPANEPWQRAGTSGASAGTVDRAGMGAGPGGTEDSGGQQPGQAGWDDDSRGDGGDRGAGAEEGGRRPGEGVATGARATDAGAGDVALLGPSDEDRFRQRWADVQARFVDDPKEAVHTADGLVAELMQSLAQGFSEHKGALEAQWQSGGDPDTEELRQALQRYRSFFNRLLST